MIKQTERFLLAPPPGRAPRGALGRSLQGSEGRGMLRTPLCGSHVLTDRALGRLQFWTPTEINANHMNSPCKPERPQHPPSPKKHSPPSPPQRGMPPPRTPAPSPASPPGGRRTRLPAGRGPTAREGRSREPGRSVPSGRSSQAGGPDVVRRLLGLAAAPSPPFHLLSPPPPPAARPDAREVPPSRVLLATSAAETRREKGPDRHRVRRPLPWPDPAATPVRGTI